MLRKGLRDFLTQQKIKSLLERYNNRCNVNISQLSRVFRDRDLTLLTLHYLTSEVPRGLLVELILILPHTSVFFRVLPYIINNDCISDYYT